MITSKKRAYKNKRKPKEIKVIYEYIGDKGSEADKLDAKRRLEEIFDMLFTEITKELNKSPKRK